MEGSFQFGFDGVGSDFVVSEDEDLLVGVVVVALDAQSGIEILGELGTGEVEEVLSLVGEAHVVEGEKFIFHVQAIFPQLFCESEER